jgi:hypothetical protein
VTKDKEAEKKVRDAITSLQKWQEETGITLIEITDPGGVPTIKDGSRLRQYDASNMHRMVAEVMELAQADPVYGISKDAAMKRAVEKVAEKYKRMANEKKGDKK